MDTKCRLSPRVSDSIFTKAHQSEEGEEGIIGGGAAFGENKKTLSDSDMTNFPKKIPLKALTVFPCGRIVRFFAAAEVADELKSIAQNVGDIERYLDRRK
ncbi:TPA: hypothetical protein ACJ3GU_000382, partial [Neisseria meningitidis]